MTEPPSPQELLRHAESLLPDYLRDLRATVDLDCGTFTPDGVNQVVDLLYERFRDGGWETVRTKHSPGPGEPRLGDLLVARLGGGRPASAGGRRLMMVGHTDTVFDEGTAAARPFRIEKDRALGPGVTDMKAGLLGGLAAVRCLQASDFDAFDSITFVCNPDEEIGSPFSGPEILRRAGSADACFVLEEARENGDVVSARKGVADVHLTFHGRAAHAGVEPERGRSAIAAAALAVLALHSLADPAVGVSVNAGVISGGTRANVVAEECELRVDVRAPTRRSFERALEDIEKAVGGRSVPGVTVEVDATVNFPPMERTPEVARLVELAVAAAAELGFDLRDAATGGASDANPIAGLGVPVLDGLGPVGGASHSKDEWMDVGSVPSRVALLATLLCRA